MKDNKLIWLLQILACIIILSSFSLEYFFNISVCSLCLIQRSLWILLIFITLLIKNKGIILLIILASMLISFYQILMQYGFIYSTCDINIDSNVPVISCAEKDFLIMGLPLSFYNMIINLILFIFIITKISNNKKDTQKNDVLFEEENF